ncbi:flagellar basal body rod protein FlgB [Haloimpatiens lingqiaonensis]|uniref:flagellar basal body rod protein FlgB n=1 Tax=Haloimpatiens lingqiaonensis TaxID=1380675 RepID=UPI0010FE9C69|nr:flagellar basal body rod protein FlgB [Haloimpatiens lingqiaonensis]
MRIENVNTYNLLKKSLDAASLRSKVISNNLANINTKGYKRRYVTFEENLKNAEDGLNMKKTSEKHLAQGGDWLNMEIKKDNQTSMREDGNNVDIDSEIVNQSANTLMYDALTVEINNRILMRRSVIKGGR